MSVITHLTFTPAVPVSWELLHIKGVEALSSLFEYHLTFRAPEGERVAKHLGEGMGCQLVSGGKKRVIHGYVAELEQGEQGLWKATLLPQMALTRQRRNLRVFQNLSVTEVVCTILKEYGISPQMKSLVADYPPQPFWLQYQERDFDFISRLLERAGIHYCFSHQDKAHQLIFVDHAGGYPKASGNDLVWQETWRTPEANTLRDFTFYTQAAEQKIAKQKSSGWLENVSLPALAPNGEQWKQHSERSAAVRAESLQSAKTVLYADALACWMNAGELIKLTRHSELGNNYCVVALEMDIHNEGGGVNKPLRLKLQPGDTVLRPEWKTPLPLMPGVMSALVVGPDSEAVNTDKHGRVKIRFLWDEEQGNSDSTSCWVRVSQGWSGASFGTFCLPRIGSEVLVSFIQGNPNLPVITGSLFNEGQPWPVALPKEKLLSGIITRSAPDGDNSQGHRLVFDDRKDAEVVQIHSQKDLSLKTKDKYLADITGTADIAIGSGRTTQIKEGDDVLNLNKGNYRLTIKGDYVQETEGDCTQKIKGACLQETEGDWKVTVKGGKSAINATKSCTIESSEKIVLKVGGSELSISATGITLKAPTLKLEGSASVGIKGAKVDLAADAIANIKGNAMVVIDGGLIKIG